MVAQRKQHIVTYYGLDGACAAALALKRFPAANVLTTSARRVGETLQQLSQSAVCDVHLCGVGTGCDWAEVRQACEAIRKRGGEVFWYCGRGYLDRDRDRYAEVCTPVFIEAESNTGALAKHLQLTDDPVAGFLTELAPLDHNISRDKPFRKKTSEQEDWCDFVAAAISQYFKYQDEEVYRTAIYSLANRSLTEEDRHTLDIYRQTGFKYVLHGRSLALKTLRERIKKCARINRPLIIMGESGVGKEHVAQLIREASARCHEPFIVVNCALYAGSASLANSDIFGHVKGAFTGAEKERAGKLSTAHKGILYLDEVGELPLEVQAKLLRVFEDGQVTPEGADRPTGHVDVRIIAATNRELPEMVRAGTFRADLYHRLSTLRLFVPPLRDHLEDIRSILEEHLISLAKEGYERTLTRGDYQALKGYDWPGNVRQLIKLVERAFYLDMSIAEAIAEEEALGELRVAVDVRPSPDELLLPRTTSEVRPIEEVRNQYAQRAWELFDRNYTATAKALGIRPNTLRYKYLKEKKQQS
ncbi:MAG TPA: sigma 54-interacting transcriptional regulator [Candidatus Hydrogenedentes bacterium]|nr:sigma 54-interacting transcriptional regulator [Candidatus Hydrogenedentota bacterium]HPJ98555.1 sigma 54-interacting transcriptional regulator [Candidatus Hydrogenedentota bacterium]